MDMQRYLDTRARRAGRRAAKEGKDESDNPYPKNSGAWADWLAGFRS